MVSSHWIRTAEKEQKLGWLVKKTNKQTKKTDGFVSLLNCERKMSNLYCPTCFKTSVTTIINTMIN